MKSEDLGEEPLNLNVFAQNPEIVSNLQPLDETSNSIFFNLNSHEEKRSKDEEKGSKAE